MSRKKQEKINKEEVAQRLRSAYNYLMSNRIDDVVEQKDIAARINGSESTISQAVTGKEKYLTRSLIRRFCIAFPMISQEWLLTGEGSMLDGTEAKMDGAILFKLSDSDEESSLKEPKHTYGTDDVRICLEKIIELSQELGRLKAENEALKKELAQVDNNAECATASDTG